MNALHLPDQVGVMILPDCVLFPHGGLPLRIFEDRYRMMLQDAIDGDCLFAVTQQISEDSADPQQCAAPVGTIGIIRASHEQEDGTSHLLLHGIIRVKFLEWLDEKPYPVATIQPTPTAPASNPPASKPAKSIARRRTAPAVARSPRAEASQQAMAGTITNGLIQTATPHNTPSANDRANGRGPGRTRQRRASRQGRSIHGSRWQWHHSEVDR